MSPAEAAYEAAQDQQYRAELEHRTRGSARMTTEAALTAAIGVAPLSLDRGAFNFRKGQKGSLGKRLQMGRRVVVFWVVCVRV